MVLPVHGRGAKDELEQRALVDLFNLRLRPVVSGRTCDLLACMCRQSPHSLGEQPHRCLLPEHLARGSLED